MGLLPSLEEVLHEFPERMFLINVKGNQTADADVLAAYLEAREFANSPRLRLIGGERFAARWDELGGHIPVSSKFRSKQCVKRYLLTGWLGRVPEICVPFGIGVPLNYARLYWGWPERLVNRIDDEGGIVMLVGPLDGETDGIDTLEAFDSIPPSYRGWVYTNRIDIVGAAEATRAH